MPSATVAVLLAAVAAVATAGPADHAVPSLPGWHSALPSRMWAGLVPAGQDGQYKMYEHYFFAESEGDPSKDPVIVWTNGGPGASSFYGFFIELGTFYMSDESVQTKAYNLTGIPTLFLNPYRWTKHASVLILNSPPPVGFSYCDPIGPTGNGSSCGAWDDTRTAKVNHEFLLNWIKLFPEFAKNGLYIIGESYAGVYVPMLAQLMLNDTDSPFNLQGFAVGDGCAGTEVLCGAPGGTVWHVEFLYGHGQVSNKMYAHVKDKCTDYELIHGVNTTECKEALKEMDDSVGGYFSYNLYDTCYQPLSAQRPQVSWTSQQSRSFWSRGFGGALHDYPCGGYTVLLKYMSLPQVKQALHVSANAVFFSGDNAVGLPYNLTEKNLMPFYRYVAQNTSLRVLVYNGDTDPGINSFISQNWTTALGLNEIEAWRPWTLDGKQEVAGYVTRYEGSFDFLTIRGSGHMVPLFAPKAALSFLEIYLNNASYPRYVPPSRK